jgi:hypothetical protein
MATANLIQLPRPSKSAITTRRSTRAARALRRQAVTAAGLGLVACTVTALSLHHLANGVAIVTGSSQWESWAMAVGIDLGFVALELAQVATVSDKVRRQVARFAKPAIVGTLLGSAGMNAFAFAAQAAGPVMTAAAVTMGVAIPSLIFALTRVGASMYIDCHSRG